MTSYSTITHCRACGSGSLAPVVSLGMLPLANAYPKIGDISDVARYPHELVRCDTCELVQLSITAPREEVFPASYPYTSSTTKALRDNFADLARWANWLRTLEPGDLVIDIGGNDGNLLSNFVGKQRVLNVTPEDIGTLGVERGITHHQSYWDAKTAADVVATHGKARLITATNVFAHIDDPGAFLDAMIAALDHDGMLCFEVQYFGDTVRGNQWDHVYLEHQVLWSFRPLARLLESRGLRVLRVTRIGTHGGSIRVYATLDTAREPTKNLGELDEPTAEDVLAFGRRVAESREQIRSLLASLDGKAVGIGAPSRASTLVAYCGIDHAMVPWVAETAGSYKVGRYMPGTRIEIVDEARLYEERPEYALLFSHHIADELMPKIRAKGFAGKFIVPLPEARVVQ